MRYKTIPLLCLFTLLLLSGCVKVDTSVTIHQDDSAEFAYKVSIPHEVIKLALLSGTDLFATLDKEVETVNNVTIIESSDDNYQIKTYTIKIPDIVEWSQNNPAHFIKATRTGSELTISGNLDNFYSVIDNETLEYIEVSFYISVPGFVLENNGIMKHDNTYEWDYTKGADNSFIVTTAYNKAKTTALEFTILILGMFALCSIIVIYAKHKRQ